MRSINMFGSTGCGRGQIIARIAEPWRGGLCPFRQRPDFARFAEPTEAGACAKAWRGADGKILELLLLSVGVEFENL